MCSITHIDPRLIVDVPCRDEVALIGKDVFAGLVQDVTPGAWSDTHPLLAQPIMENVNQKCSMYAHHCATLLRKQRLLSYFFCLSTL